MTDKPKIGMPSRISAEGEGAFLSFFAKHAILHKVCTSDDIGIDYFGEWMNQKTDKTLESTNILFAIQLKTSHVKNVEKTFLEKDKRLNQLEAYKLQRKWENKNDNRIYYKDYDDIKDTTIEYWKGFEIPVYLFVVLLSSRGNELYYKRFTPVLHDTEQRRKEKFYKASNGTNFLAFAKKDNTGGFCRDLFIDYIRCNYKKGSIAYKNPKSMGLSQFPESPKTLFIDMIQKEYKNEILNTYIRLNELGFFDKVDPNSVPDSSVSSGKSSSTGSTTLLLDLKK